MAADPLDEVLRLVAEGRLTAEEAAPILAALDEQAAAGPPPSPARGRIRAARRAGFDDAARPADWPGPTTEPGPRRRRARSGSRSARRGRQVVNLRLPIAVGRFALDRVPGLSGDQVDRVREAMSSGFRGPILAVDDDGDGVRILVE